MNFLDTFVVLDTSVLLKQRVADVTAQLGRLLGNRKLLIYRGHPGPGRCHPGLDVIPDSPDVIPDLYVIPDLIRDPVVRQYWIAGRGPQ